MALDGSQLKGTNGSSQWFLSRLTKEKPTARRVGEGSKTPKIFFEKNQNERLFTITLVLAIPIDIKNLNIKYSKK